MRKAISIRTRLTALYTSLLFVALVVFAAAATQLLRSRLIDDVHAALDQRIHGVENFLRRETTATTAHMIPEEIAEYAFTQPEGHLIDVRDESGNILLRGETTPAPYATREDVFDIYGKRYHVRASASLALVESAIGELWRLFLGLAPVLLAVAMGIGYWVSGRALAPVDAMTRVARAIRLSNLSERLYVSPARDELSRLAQAWNETLGTLEESVTRIQRFTTDAAHELRTPLTAIRTTAELATRRERSAGEYRRSLEEIRTISERMSALVDRLLALARGDTAVTAPSEASDLGRAVRATTDELGSLFAEKGVSLTIDTPPAAVHAAAEEGEVRRILSSLLENALHYTPAGGQVVVAVSEDEQALRLDVTDSGCGIAAESLPHIFDRFYRVDPSRARASGGCGLGLAIAQQIARRNGSRLTVDSTPGKGSRFSLILQRAS